MLRVYPPLPGPAVRRSKPHKFTKALFDRNGKIRNERNENRESSAFGREYSITLTLSLEALVLRLLEKVRHNFLDENSRVVNLEALAVW